MLVWCHSSSGMKSILILFLMSNTGIAAATGELTTVPFSRSEYALRATTSKEEVLLEASDLLVDFKYPNGKEGRGDLLVLFDKSSGHFVWHYGSPYMDMTRPKRRLAELFAHDSIAYVESDRIVIWKVMEGGGLRIDESSRRAENLYDAEAKALREVTGQLENIERGRGAKEYKELFLQLTHDFLSPKNSATWGPLKLLGVSRQDGRWQVIIEGQWKVKAILNDKYELIDTERIP